MTALDLYEEHLVKTSFFSDLDSKVEGIVKLGGPNKEIKDYVTANFGKFILFDKSYQNLLKFLQENKDLEIEETDVEQLKFISGIQSELVASLERINAQNPRDVNTVFAQLSQSIEQRGFNGEITVRSPQGRELSLGKRYTDFLIDEINKFINKYSPAKERDFSEIENALVIAKQLIKDKKKFEEAAQTAENWISADAGRVSGQLADASIHFRNESRSYTGFWSQYVWLLGAGILALGVFGLLLYFAFSDTEIKTGQALLKITSVTVLIYFVYLFVSLFVQAKTYRESYIFKSVALQTMTSLVQSFPDPSDKAITMQSAMSVIFTEPATKQTKALQQKYIDDVIEIAKKKL